MIFIKKLIRPLYNTYIMKHLTIIFALLLVTTSMMADEFKIGKLTFEITSSTEVALTKADKDITKAFLSETIDYQGNTYILTEIRGRAFDGCSSLSSITIPCSVEDIETMAFFNCKSLTSVTILSCRFGIDISIQYMAFWGCSSLKSVTIPDNIKKYFYWDAFEGSALYDDPSNWENGALYIDNCLIEVDTSFVGNFKIKENTYLIADEAFKDCQSLISVTIPNGVKVIGDGAFLGCKSLTSVTIPNSVTEIGSNAFEGCSALASVTIPNSVTEIGNYIFKDCSSLTSIVVDIANEYYDSRGNCNAIIDTSTDMLIVGCKNTTIPNSVTGIEWYAFEGHSSLTSINIPNSVTEIRGFAFKGSALYNNPANWENGALYINDCLIQLDKDYVGNYTIKRKTRLIADWALDGCTSLTSITIPNSVTEIGWGAFEGCTNLKAIYIPIGSKARFAKMDGLEDLQHLLIER